MTDYVTLRSRPDDAEWFKSSYSGGEGNECVEVADLRPRVAIRDSKASDGPVLDLTAAAFTAFLGGVKDGGLGLTG